MKKVKLKKANQEDVEVVLQITQSVNGKTFHQAANKTEAQEYIEESHVFLVYKDDELVGLGSFLIRGNNLAQINGVVALAKWRGKGIGKTITQELLKKLSHYKEVVLHVHPHNSAAICMYIDFGFVIDAWIDNCHGDGEPRLLMRRVQ